MTTTLHQRTLATSATSPFKRAMAPSNDTPLKPSPALLHGLLLPGALLWALALRFVVGFSLAGVAIFTLPLLLAYILTPIWVRRGLARYDQDETKFLAGRDLVGLRARLDRSWLLRHLSPPALILERRGRLAAAQDAHEEAREAYQQAMRRYEGQPPLSVVLGAAHASFHLGDWRAAARGYRKLIKKGAAFPTVADRLALAEAEIAALAGSDG